MHCLGHPRTCHRSRRNMWSRTCGAGHANDPPFCVVGERDSVDDPDAQAASSRQLGATVISTGSQRYLTQPPGDEMFTTRDLLGNTRGPLE
jgi:hypothetical protein